MSKHSRVFMLLILLSLAGCREGASAVSTPSVGSTATPTISWYSPTVVAGPTSIPSPIPTPTAIPPALTPLQLSLRWRYPTNETVWSLAVADLDGDGIREVIAGSYDKHVYALGRDGQLVWRYRTGAAIYALDTGDLDGDGRIEVVVGGDDNRLRVLDAYGELIWEYLAGSRVTGILVEDVDGDGAAEVLAGAWGGQLYLLEAGGDVSWRVFADEGVATVQCADLDNDGQLEILVGLHGGEVLVVGVDGNLRWRYRTGGYVRELGAYDLDHDGHKEIVVAAADGWVYAVSDEGHLKWRRRLGSPVMALHMGDIDDDGRGEVVVGTGSDKPQICLLSDLGEVRWCYQAAKGVWTVTAADVDDDGLLELLAGADDGTVSILDVHGRLLGSYRTARRVHGLVVNDLDGDGRQDVVARSGNDVYLLAIAPRGAVLGEAEDSPELATLPGWTGAQPGAVDSSEELIELVAVGDIMLSRTIEERMDLYGSDYPFLGTADLIRSADIAIGNLECPLSAVGEPIDKRFTFRAHPRHAPALAQAGFDVLSLANNHLLDFGREGLVETMEALQRQGLAHVGAGLSYQEAHRPLIWQGKGRTVAFLAYAASRWKGSSEVPTAEWIAFAELDTIREDVRQTREQADLVVVIMHLGTEYQGYPDDEQLVVSRAAIEAGASLVIGHHPHVVQGTASYGGGFIAYSLGNFVFDIDTVERAREGAILRVLLGDEGVEAAELIPVRILDDVQPRFLADDDGLPVVERVF